MMLEVASLGTPILCSDIPENLNVLPDQALHFESGNVGDLQLKLALAMEKPGMMKELAVQAQDWVHQQYLWDRIVPRYQALYEAVMAGYEAESPLISAIPEKV